MATRERKRSTKLATNVQQLVKLSVCGEVIPAVWPRSRPYRIGGDGVLRVLSGTGVTTLLTSREGAIEPVIDQDANIGKYLGLGRWRRGRRKRATRGRR